MPCDPRGTGLPPQVCVLSGSPRILICRHLTALLPLLPDSTIPITPHLCTIFLKF